VQESGFRGIAEKLWAVVRSFVGDAKRDTEHSSRHVSARGGADRGWTRALVSVVVAAVGSVSLLVVGGLTALPASAATGAPSVSQCNPPDFPAGAGFQVTCSVSVENYTSSSGATSSTVTTSACLAVAGVVYPSCPLNSGPVTSTTISTQLVTSVNQCNGVVNGGGSNVYCNVAITNNVPAGTSTSGVSVNQCNGSVTGNGGTIACTPTASTTNATVDQCNDSVTGGGTYAGEPTAGCTVTGSTSADPVTVNQCNGTATGGGSAITCAATFANVIAVATPTGTTPTPTGSTGTGGSTTGTGGTSGTTGTGAAAGSGLGGGSGGAVGAGGSTGTASGLAGAAGTTAVIPTGAPQTGFGGASRSTSPELLYVGGAALAAAALTMVLAVRRRRGAIVECPQSNVPEYRQ
jgi:hypothetical protein